MRAFVVSLLVAALVAVDASAQDDLRRVSTRGTPTRIGHREIRMLRPFELEGAWLLTTRRGIAFYRVETRNHGRCWGIGKRRPVRLGSIGCTRGFPSARVPVLDRSLFGASRDDPTMRLIRLVGFAADGVAEIRLLGHRDAVFARVPVERNAYVLLAPPRGVRAIVAVDDDGDAVYRQRYELRRVPPPRVVGPPRPRKPTPIPPRPAGTPIQHGAADGVTVEVYRNGPVFFRIAPGSRADRLTRGGPALNAGCLRLGRWKGTWEADSYVTTRGIAAEVAVPMGRRYHSIDPPFHACTVSGMYGRRWNDARDYRAAAEIAFTASARQFFAEQEAARDLAYFVRSPVLAALRKSLRRGGTAPAAADLARRIGSRVLPIRSPHAHIAPGLIGVWTNGRDAVTAVRWTTGGERLFVTISDGRIVRQNLSGLAFAF